MARFEENIAAAADAVGLDKLGIVFGLAMSDWTNSEERDEFLRKLTSKE
jgi:hypothetical protein